METQIAAAVAQFGAAGLIAWMWLAERRSAAARDKQIAEAHGALTRERGRLDILVRALESNTRAITSLEVGQRHLARLIENRGMVENIIRERGTT